MNREYAEVLVEQNINGAMDTAYVYGASNGAGSGRLSLGRFDGSRGYYLYDPRGSVAGITNGEGQVYQSYRYSAFGEATYGAPVYENEYTYNGESYNPNIRSQYLRARYYDVVNAAFLTEDFYPQDMWALWDVKEPLTLNRYNYCAGNPLYYVDRSGHVLLPAAAGFVVGAIGGFIVGTVTEAGKLIEQGADYDWQAGVINIANTTTAGAVGGTVFGATLNPILAATAAGGTYGGLSELSGSVARGDSVLQTVENTARGTAFGTVAGYAGGVMGMGTAGYMAAAGAPVLLQVTASGAVAGISSGATHRALAGQDTTPEAVAMDGLYGSVSALTFYGTGLAYERVTAPKLPNTYIRDRLAAAEEMGRSEGCEGGNETQIITNKFPYDNQTGRTFNYSIENGKVMFENGIHEVDFVVDMDGDLQLGRGHSYLAGGESVQAAGTMQVNSQGYVRLITNESGHFQPTVTQAMNYPNVLRSTGLNVNNTWIRMSSFNTSMSNYVIETDVFYNGPIQYMPK